MVFEQQNKSYQPYTYHYQLNNYINNKPATRPYQNFSYGIPPYPYSYRFYQAAQYEDLMLNRGERVREDYEKTIMKKKISIIKKNAFFQIGFLLILSLIAIILQSVAIAQKANLSHVGTGIWGGVYFIFVATMLLIYSMYLFLISNLQLLIFCNNFFSYQSQHGVS